MTKSLLISQPSSRLVNVLNELAKYLVVKRVNKDVLEKLDRGETVEAYLYCTKGKPELLNIGDGTYKLSQCNCNAYNQLNGTIPVKVVIDGYYQIMNTDLYSYTYHKHTQDILKGACIDEGQLCDYMGQVKPEERTTYNVYNPVYVLHISKVEILDEVMKLGDFVTWDNDVWHGMTHWKPVTRPQQNCMEVWVK